MARLDPHSYADDQQPQVRRLDWKMSVDFAARTLTGTAELELDRDTGGPLDLDTRELTIREVTDATSRALKHSVHAAEPIFGSRLSITLPPGTQRVRIAYATSPHASALQWLEPAQTSGDQPFLFSQCQAIHARSIVPIQDTPRVRITYRAELSVPARLQTVMAAGPLGREVRGAQTIDRFEMPQPIPPYLLAFAVGDLAFKDLSPRCRVWAEPKVVEAAAWEFADLEKMISAAEALFGPYPWERYDVLTLPRSFPYGGMENPRLTFVTPSLLAGDRSLVSVIAHELAHSWTGNLVTNANAEHFWLNEGFTVFAERRILEALEGPSMCALHEAIGLRTLEKAFEQHRDQPGLTRLRTHLKGIDPDEAFSSVPYEKGCLFLRALENAVGRERFDVFVRRYLEQYRFGTVTTEQFTALVERELPGVLAQVGATQWIDEPGLPANAPRPSSARLDAILRIGPMVPEQSEAARWTPVEWQLYLESLPRNAPRALFDQLDNQWALTKRTNYEVLVSWLNVAVRAGYAPAIDRTREVLGQIGRMKYLRPLYQALAELPSTRGTVRALFEGYRGGYHPIAQQVLDGLLTKRDL